MSNTTDPVAAHIARVVAQAPPLTDEQRDRVRSLLAAELGAFDAVEKRLHATEKTVEVEHHKDHKGQGSTERRPVKTVTSAQQNPFGRWTEHRARIAALSRSDARDDAAEAEARRNLRAARLADAIIKARGDITAEQRRLLAELLA